MFNNLSIRTRLISIIGLLSILLIGVGGLGIYGLKQTNDSFKGVYEDRAVPLGYLALVIDRMQRVRLNTAMASHGNDAEIAKEMKESNNQIDVEITATWQKYLATNLTAIEKTLIEAFNQERKELVEIRERTISSALSAHYDEAIKSYDEEFSRKYDAAHATIFKLLELQRDEGAKEFGIAQNNYENIFITNVSLIVLGVSLAVLIGFMLIRAIIDPLNEAVKVANAVAVGDLTSLIEKTSNDEIGRLLQALKAMNDNLADLVGKVRADADQIETAASEIASGNSDLSQRTEEQASSLEETASTMEELTSTVKQNADNARQANQLAAGASEVAVKGGEVVGQVVQTMSSINESSKKIVDIISVIDGIAFQTNILALNAAVEAARAGEQGRGFAVVATEVRTLAQRSAAAAKEIKELIGDSVSKVEDGTRLVDEAGATMNEIVNAVKRVTDIMSEISAASQEQSSGIEQVNQAVAQMDEVTQQNAALVEEAAAAAESMQGQAQALAQAVMVFKLSSNNQITATPARKNNSLPSVTKLPNRRPTLKKATVNSNLDSTSTPAHPRKIAMGGGSDDWEEF